MRTTWAPGTRPEGLREPDEWDDIDLAIIRESHDQADHGVRAIEAFVLCYESRISPPQWVIDWLGERFASWLDGNADSIDQAMEVKSPGRGRPPRLKQVQADCAQHNNAWLMLVLIEQCNKSVPTAAAMVHQRNVEADVPTPEPNRLADSWRENWRNSGFVRNARAMVAEIFSAEDRRRQFLESFPYRP